MDDQIKMPRRPFVVFSAFIIQLQSSNFSKLSLIVYSFGCWRLNAVNQSLQGREIQVPILPSEADQAQERSEPLRR